MNSILDSILSLIIGSIIVVLINSMMLNMRSTSVHQTQTTIVQSNLTTLTDVLDNDFRKMGYRVPAPGASPPDSGIRFADSSSIMIKGDFDNNGSIDSIRYYMGTKPSENFNPRTRFLVRRVNLTGVGISQQSINVGLTRFRLTYFDSTGLQLPVIPPSPRQIKSIKVTVNLESTYPSEIRSKPPDTTFAYATWEQMIKPRNLK